MRRVYAVLFSLLSLALLFSCNRTVPQKPAETLLNAADFAAIRLRQKAMERFDFLNHQAISHALENDYRLAFYEGALRRIALQEKARIRMAKEELRWTRQQEWLVSRPIPSIPLDASQEANERLVSIASFETAHRLLIESDRKLDSSGRLEAIDRIRNILHAQERFRVLHGEYACSLQTLVKKAMFGGSDIASGKAGMFSFSLSCGREKKGKRVSLFAVVAVPVSPKEACFCADQTGGVYMDVSAVGESCIEGHRGAQEPITNLSALIVPPPMPAEF